MIAIKNLFRHKLRTLITLLGVAVGISAFVSLTSISDGFKTQMEDIIKSYSIDITVTSKGAFTPNSSTISFSAYRELGRVKGVRDASCLIVGTVTSPLNPYFLVFGASSVERFLNRLGLVEGRVFIPGKKEVIMGERAASRYRIRVNDNILLARQEMFTVTGVFTSGSGIIDGAAVLDIKDAQELLRRFDSFNMVFLQVAVGSDLDKVVDDINKQFPNLTAVKSGEFIGQIRLFNTVDFFAWVVSVISFVTCCIIIMNTFVMTVSERTKEIGILMAVGWSRIMIMKTIISESVVICFFGGILGNMMAIAELWVFYTFNPGVLAWLDPLSISMDIFLKSIGLSLLLGMSGSLYPAIRASRLLPAEALRYE